MTRDPVCQLEVDPEVARAQSEFLGHTMFFCSEECMWMFEADPERYVEET